MRSKIELRVALRQARSALTETEVAEKSARIVARLEALLGPHGYQAIHCYEPIAGLHEVNVAPFIDFLEAKNIRVYTSRYIDGRWQVVALAGGQIPGRSVRYDCVIVPMLGFDRRLHRLGQGGGYYDRLLSGHSEAFKLGVCFELGKLPELPSEPHDVSLDALVTEAQIYRV